MDLGGGRHRQRVAVRRDRRPSRTYDDATAQCGLPRRRRTRRVADLWISTAVGLVPRVAIADEAALEDLGDRLGESIPRLLIAVVVVIGGYVVSIALRCSGRPVRTHPATGVRQRTLERTLQAAVVAASVVVALAELGVDGPVLVVLVAVAVGAPASTLAMLSVLGGRHIAAADRRRPGAAPPGAPRL